MNSSFYLLVVIGSPALLFLAIVFIYAVVFRTSVKWWFGEDTGYRRERDATRRRRSFENRCLAAAKFLYFTWIASVLQSIVVERLPELSRLFWAARIAMFIVAVLFVYGAYVRLRTPEKN